MTINNNVSFSNQILNIGLQLIIEKEAEKTLNNGLNDSWVTERAILRPGTEVAKILDPVVDLTNKIKDVYESKLSGFSWLLFKISRVFNGLFGDSKKDEFSQAAQVFVKADKFDKILNVAQISEDTKSKLDELNKVVENARILASRGQSKIDLESLRDAKLALAQFKAKAFDSIPA